MSKLFYLKGHILLALSMVLIMSDIVEARRRPHNGSRSNSNINNKGLKEILLSRMLVEEAAPHEM